MIYRFIALTMMFLALGAGSSLHASVAARGAAGSDQFLSTNSHIAALGERLSAGQKDLLTSPQRALSTARAVQTESMALPESADKVMLIAKADWLGGAALVQLNDPAHALAMLKRGSESGIGRIAPNSKLAGDLLMARAQVLLINGTVEEALPALLRAYSIYSAAHEARSQSLALQNIGSIYLVARDFDSALRYYRQASEAYQADPALLVSLYNNRATAYAEQGRTSLAEAEFSRAVDQARKIGSPVLEVRFLGSLALSQIRSGKIESAESTVARGFAMAKAAPVGDWRPALYGAAAEVALKRGQMDRAASLIEEAFAGTGLEHANVSLRSSLHTGYEIYKAKGDMPRALAYLEAYKTLDDKARAIAASTGAALMAARFDFARQETQIAQRDLAIRTAAAQFRSTILKGLLAGAAIVTSLLLFGYLSIRRSRNEVRAANADLSQSNSALEKALAARTEFLAMTSHEIRTPLNGILGMTQVLLADRAMETEMRGKIELVHGAGETMKALVDDLLDVAKMATGEIAVHAAPFDLRRLLRDAGEVWAGQAQTQGLKLALDIDATPPRIVGDEVRLRQIVFNLMSNAIKFTDRGEVRLTVSTVAAGAGDEGERLRIAVADTGVGVPADKAEEIFESFRQIDSGTTRRHGGTGLGLSICRSLARALGGDVLLTSVEGAGSTFTLDLPLVRAEDEPAPVLKPIATDGLGGARLLLVEANPLSQSVMRAVLTPHVASLAMVPGLTDALAAVAGDAADLILADGATLGLDIAAASALARAAAARDVRFALLWPAPDEAVCAAARAAGLAEPIGKPIAAPDLVAALHTMYREATSPERAACAA